jgi:hypothetical protein
MTKVFIEPRQKDGKRGALSTTTMSSRRKVITSSKHSKPRKRAWAKSEGHSPSVARVRHLNDKRIPDHWRPWVHQ